MAPHLYIFISLLLAATVVAKPPARDATTNANVWNAAQLEADDDDHALNVSSTCNGRLGECNEDEEMAMESAFSRRILINRRVRHISYEVLKKNKVPCGRRGASYYDCHGHTQVNPYRRACTVITQCARILH